MKSLAIQFEHVSKRYLLRHQKTGYLKDRLTSSVRRLNPFARDESATRAEEFWALHDVSFDIEPGESVGIVGPNGSGKSTTLKILAGVTQQSSGRVSINGKLGALIEVGAGFHPELTGRENVFLNGSILGMKKAEIERKFDDIVAFAEVEKFIDTPIKHYSSGMYVRLGFAIAIHNEPEILLVDEVLAVGDLSFQMKCAERMQAFKKSGRTFILISHSMPQVQALCDRVIFLEKGRMIADGAASDVTELYTLQQGGSARQPEASAPVAPSPSAPPEAQAPAAPLHNVQIVGMRIVDENRRSTETVAPGRAITIEFDFEAERPVSNAVGWVHIEKNGVRILDCDTAACNEHLGDIIGRGTLRCSLPKLPLMPNTYDVHVGIFNERIEPEGLQAFPNGLCIATEASDISFGCGWMPDPELRSLVFGTGAWTVRMKEPVPAVEEGPSSVHCSESAQLP